MFSINKKLNGWSRASSTKCQIFYPENLEDLKKVINHAIKNNFSICPKGSGNSYGDEFQNESNIVADTSMMNKILSWDIENGIINVESGVSIKKLLKVSLKNNWILPAIPGTRLPTIGGCVSNNVHGKNSFRNGNFGDCVIEIKILVASNEVLTCSRNTNKELFYAAIGGIGLLGIIVSVKMQLIKIPSPNVLVDKWTVPDLNKMIDDLIESSNNYNYVIGQVDCFAPKMNLGRGTIHAARHTKSELNKKKFLNDLEISDKIFSFIPSKSVVNLGRILLNDKSMKLISSSKFYWDKYSFGKTSIHTSFPEFNFLIDKIPNWPKIFNNGFYEFEPLIPMKNAKKVIKKLLKLYNYYGMPSYLSALKLHRSDDFLLSYSLNGFSIGFDFPILPKRLDEQREMFIGLHKIVAESGGLIYLAKDNIVTKEYFKKMYGIKIDKYLDIKMKYDPDMIFQSNLYRRLFTN